MLFHEFPNLPWEDNLLSFHNYGPSWCRRGKGKAEGGKRKWLKSTFRVLIVHHHYAHKAFNDLNEISILRVCVFSFLPHSVHIWAHILSPSSIPHPHSLLQKLTHLSNRDLECGLRISEVCLVMFHSLIPPVEPITTSITVPVCSFKFFLPLNYSNNVTMITAT